MADIGSTLREARMRARIDISEVEARTKIRAKYLRAIENEEWDLLPGPVYVCLVDGAGNKLIPGKIFSKGQPIPAQSAPKLLLTLGNASVRMSVNGQVVSVAPSSSSIGYVFTPTNHHMLSVAKQPTCK